MKTTPRQFDAFVNEVKRLLTKFGLLNDYELRFQYVPLETRAAVVTNYTGRNALFKFTTDWPEASFRPSIKEAQYVAKHEAIHLLLSDYACIANDRYVTRDEADVALESLVRKLETLIT